MTVKVFRRLVIAALFVTVASAAWFLPRRPIVAGVLLAFVAAGVLLTWWIRRDERRANAAGLACDLDALERSAARGGARIFASFALIHHGGFARARTSLCTCGECEQDRIDEDLAHTARIVRAAYEGRGGRAYELAEQQDPMAKDVPAVYAGHLMQLRLLTRLVAYAAAVEDDADRPELPIAWVDLVVKLGDTSWPILRWPVRLAAAREAAARGDKARARELLADMPAWPDGTPLESVRRRLRLEA